MLWDKDDFIAQVISSALSEQKYEGYMSMSMGIFLCIWVHVYGCMSMSMGTCLCLWVYFYVYGYMSMSMGTYLCL